MSYFVHKITVSNWTTIDDNEITDEEFELLKADGITNDLKSNNNEISFWEIDSLSENELNDISISILTGRDEKQDLSIVAIPKADLDEHFRIKKSLGSTCYLKYADKHYDLIDMNYKKLGVLARIIIRTQQNKDMVFDFIYAQQQRHIMELISNEDIVLDSNKGKLKKDYKEYMNKNH